MWLHASSKLAFQIADPTPFIFALRPRNDPRQWVVRESFTPEPMVSVDEYYDLHGNRCQRLVAPPGPFSVVTMAEVETPDMLDTAPGAPFVEIPYLPNDVLHYLLPSRYCESEQFNHMAREIAGDAIPGYDQVARIDDWVRRNVRFNPDSPHFQVSAVEVNRLREGVCRDLAHIGIALCRGLAIPARIVAGYLYELEPMDLHAWFEAYVGGDWYAFDPTQPTPRGGRIILAAGRDAADVAVFSQFGPLIASMDFSVEVEQIEGPSE